MRNKIQELKYKQTNGVLRILSNKYITRIINNNTVHVQKGEEEVEPFSGTLLFYYNYSQKINIQFESISVYDVQLVG